MIEPIEPPQPLGYDSVRRPKPMLVLHGIAMICGFVPLVAGSVVFLLYLVVRDQSLAGIGFVVILVGSCCAFVGLVCASVYFFQAKNADPSEAVVAKRRVKWDVAIILANFPIAFFMAAIGIWLMTRVTLVIQNTGTSRLNNVTLIAGTERYNLGPLQPSEKISHTLGNEIGPLSCIIRRGKSDSVYILDEDGMDSDDLVGIDSLDILISDSDATLD